MPVLTKNILEPISLTTDRAIFSFPKAKILPDLKITNIYLTNANGNALTGSCFLSNVVGLYGIVKEITLYSGTIVLDTLKNVSQFMSIKQLQKQEIEHADREVELVNNSYVFDIQSSKIQLETPLNINTNNYLQLDVAQMLSFLKSETILEYHDLRLELVFETDANKVFYGANKPTSYKVNSLQCIYNETVFLEDMLEGLSGETQQKLIKKYTQSPTLQYKSIDSDSFYIPAGTQGQTQVVSNKFMGFNDKLISNLYIQFQGAASDASGLLLNTSLANESEKVQISLNGKRILPYDGLSDTNKLAYTVDTMGDIICLPLQNVVPQENLSELVQPTSEGVIYDKTNFLAVKVFQKGNEFLFDYQRNCTAVHNQPMTVRLFAETNKVRVMNKDHSVSVMYM